MMSWIWIPIVAIVVGSITEWLKVREKHRQLGSSNAELERRMAELTADQKELADMVRHRIQNLEAIVTSQTWDVLQSTGEASQDRRSILDSALDGADTYDEPSDADKVARIAQRLRA